MAVSRINEAGLNVNQYGNRNLVINGAMQVAQRGTVSGLQTGYGACDRFKISGSGTAARFDASQSTDVPSAQGFSNSLKLDVSTADTSISAGDFAILSHFIEAQNLQQLKYGTSSAQKCTLSFWVKSSKTGIHVLEVTHNDASYNNPHQYTIASANTWQNVVITFDGYTSTAINDDNGKGLELNWWLIAGSTYSGGTYSENTWGNANANRAVGQVNVGDSTSNDFYLTGVQLEVGDTATDFEHRTFDDELRRCYRYYQLAENTAGSLQYVGITQAYSTSAVFGIVKEYILPMRAVPSVGQSGDFKFSGKDSTGVATGAIGNLAASSSGWYAGGWTGGGGNLITGGASVVYWANGAKLTADAEL
tara:strand:+ start:166 stop:1254 length:1089 start_codon:yes stop_codon:yes gene_type:complete